MNFVVGGSWEFITTNFHGGEICREAAKLLCHEKLANVGRYWVVFLLRYVNLSQNTFVDFQKKARRLAERPGERVELRGRATLPAQLLLDAAADSAYRLLPRFIFFFFWPPPAPLRRSTGKGDCV